MNKKTITDKELGDFLTKALDKAAEEVQKRAYREYVQSMRADDTNSQWHE